jgi:hypothetical protein
MCSWPGGLAERLASPGGWGSARAGHPGGGGGSAGGGCRGGRILGEAVRTLLAKGRRPLLAIFAARPPPRQVLPSLALVPPVGERACVGGELAGRLKAEQLLGKLGEQMAAEPDHSVRLLSRRGGGDVQVSVVCACSAAGCGGRMACIWAGLLGGVGGWGRRTRAGQGRLRVSCTASA